MSKLRYPFAALCILLAALSPTAGCLHSTTNLITGESTRGAYTWSEEVELGRQADEQIVAEYGLYEDATLTGYVTRIGRLVLERSAYTASSTPAEVRATPFYFRVLDTDVVNAFALPGGYVYVTRGLMAHLTNEAQLAVVLGHEIGHVLGRHASRRAAAQQRGTLGVLGAAVLGGLFGGRDTAEGVLQAGGTGAGLLFLRNGREDEREADRAGVLYAEAAGYDAAHAAQFFRLLGRLSERAGGRLPSFLATHPDPGERARSIPALAAQYDTGTTVNEEDYLEALEGLVLGQNPRQGFVEDGHFYHPELRFQFDVPDTWRVANGSSAVQVSEPNGDAVMQFSLSRASSAAVAGREFADAEGFRVSQQSATDVNGHAAYTVRVNVTTERGELGALATFIEYGSRVYRFLGISDASGFARFEPTFVQTFSTFDTLASVAHLSREPVRLTVQSAAQPASFEAFLAGRLAPYGMDAEGLAIMNDVELNQRIVAGHRLKLPAGAARDTADAAASGATGPADATDATPPSRAGAADGPAASPAD